VPPIARGVVTENGPFPIWEEGLDRQGRGGESKEGGGESGPEQGL
jgi:hypothetical protein